MSTIAIAGATGTLGRPVTDLLAARGHDVRALSRTAPEHPVDLATGDGLDAALDGVDVVVHAHNAQKAATLVDGSARLLEAAPAAHHVVVSIVGIEDVPLGYYRLKVAQEAVVIDGDAPWTIVRATQFHDLVGWLVDRRRLRLRSRARVQPVAASEVAAVIADVAEGSPQRRTLTVAGPQVVTLGDLATGAVPVPLPLPPKLGRALRAGALTLDAPDVRGTTTYAQWLTTAR